MADIIDLLTGKGVNPNKLNFKNREHYKNKFSGVHFNNKFVKGIEMDGEVYKGTKLFKEIENMYGKRGFDKTSEKQFMDDLEKRGVEDKMRKRLVQNMRKVAMKDHIVDYQKKMRQKLAKRAVVQAKAGHDSPALTRRMTSALNDENTALSDKNTEKGKSRIKEILSQKADDGEAVKLGLDALGLRAMQRGSDYRVSAGNIEEGSPSSNVISINQRKKINDSVIGGVNPGQEIKPLTDFKKGGSIGNKFSSPSKGNGGRPITFMPPAANRPRKVA